MSSPPTADGPPETTGSAAGPGRNGKTVVLLFALMAVGALVYFGVAMPGMDMTDRSGPSGSSRRMNGMDMAKASPRLLTSPEFARALKRNPFVINVHTPYAGEIAGTDALIPSDQVAGDPQVPADRNALILLYCRSGRMSAIAARALLDAGYLRVAELRGGTDAWVASGRDLTGTR